VEEAWLGGVADVLEINSNNRDVVRIMELVTFLAVAMNAELAALERLESEMAENRFRPPM